MKIQKDVSGLFVSTWAMLIAFALLLSSCGPTPTLIRGQRMLSGTYTETVYITEDNVIVQDATFRDIDGDGLIIRNANNIQVIDSTFENISGFGIVLSSLGDTSNVTIEGNTLTDIGASGIISKEKDGIVHPGTIIRNNYIAETGNGNTKHHGIYAYTKDVLIERNEIHGSSGNGIAIRTSGIMTGNSVYNSAKTCMRYFTDRPSVGELLIEDNICEGTGADYADISLLDGGLGYDPVPVIIRGNTGIVKIESSSFTDVYISIPVQPGELPDVIENADDGYILDIAGIHDLNGQVIDIDKALHFVGQAGAELNNGAMLRLYAPVTLENLTFRNWRKKYQDGVLRFMGNLDGVVIDNCHFEDVPAAIYARNGGSITNISVTDSTFENINSPYKVTAIVIDDGDISDITITGNEFHNLYSTGTSSVIGILIGDNGVFAQNVLVQGNIIKDIQASLQGRGMLIYADHVRVLDNQVSNINKSSDQPRTCIYLKSDDGLIDGNVLRNCGSQAGGDLTVKKDVGYNVISNNVITGNQPNGYGIFAKTNALVTGNQINRPGVGMQLYSGSDDEWVQFTVENNTVTSDTAATIWGRVTGTGCGNSFDGRVNISADGFEMSEFCDGPPTNTPPPSPTNTPTPQLPTLTPAPGTSTPTPSPTDTAVPYCESQVIEYAEWIVYQRICEKK